MGKGSRPRPFEVDHEEFANSWDRIFGKKDNKEEKTDDKQGTEKDGSENDK